MSVYEGVRDHIDLLRRRLDMRTTLIDDRHPAIVWELAGHGYGTHAAAVGASLDEGSRQLRGWVSTLDHRISILDAMASVGHPAPAAARVPLGDPGIAVQADAKGQGRKLGSATVDALVVGDHATVAALLAEVATTSPQVSAGFLEAIGPPTVGLFPTLLYEQGVAAGDLSRFIGPMAQIVAAGLGGAWFDLTAVLAGQERSEVGPTSYLDFAEFDDVELTGAAVPYIATFDTGTITLRMPPYMRPDGTPAPPDPRLPLVTAASGWDPDRRGAFVEAFVAADALGALIDPQTPWGDGGAAVAKLIAGLGAGGELAITVAPSLLREIAGSPTAPPAIVRTAPILVGMLIRSVLRGITMR